MIGSRWRPGHRVQHGPERGAFEEVNSPCSTQAEDRVQRALLPSSYRPSRAPVAFRPEWNHARRVLGLPPLQPPKDRTMSRHTRIVLAVFAFDLAVVVGVVVLACRYL